MIEIEKELIYLLHVVIASVLTGIIGYERGRINKPAGVRTNMIVGGAVCLFVLLGKSLVIHFIDLGLGSHIAADPIRIIQAIILGISFIGAGMVFYDRKEEELKYLTSSATILFSAGIGISVALKYYILAVGITMFVIIINLLLAQTKFKKKEES